MSDPILQHLMDRVCPEKPVCLFCQKSGIYGKYAGFDRHECLYCDEFYEVLTTNMEPVGLYFSLGEYRVQRSQYSAMTDEYKLWHCKKGNITVLRVLCNIPAFHIDFSDKQALKEKLMTYLAFI